MKSYSFIILLAFFGCSEINEKDTSNQSKNLSPSDIIKESMDKINSLKQDKEHQLKLALIKWSFAHPKEVASIHKKKRKFDKSIEKLYLIRKTSFSDYLDEYNISNADFDSLFVAIEIDYDQLLKNLE